MTEYASLLSDAAQMAGAAGQIIREAYDQTSTVSQKGAIDLVTDTDHAAEKSILDFLDANYSDSPVLAEESGTRDGKGAIRWIVDPLDGTVNFAHRIPHFCVLVAAQARDVTGEYKTVAAATYDPMRSEMFLCEKGAGSTLNGRSIRVSQKREFDRFVTDDGFWL